MSVERKALLKRVKLLEEAIGLDFDYADVSGEPAADVPSIDPASIKKQLQDLGYGFVLQLPLDKLKRLQKFYDEVLIFTQFKKYGFIQIDIIDFTTFGVKALWTVVVPAVYTEMFLWTSIL